LTACRYTRSTSGFTLLELLVAVSIFALISAMAYSGLQSVMNQQQQTAQRSERLADLQLVYRVMQRDLGQLIARPIRNQFGDEAKALEGGSGFAGVEFSRAGYPNPAGFLRSEIQRVAYLPDQDVLLRRSWRVLDRAQDSEPDEQVLVEQMERFEMRFLDNNDQWQDRWPPLQNQAGTDPGLPKAVEVQLALEEIGTLNWLFRVPQAPQAAPQQGGAGGAGNQEDDENQDGQNQGDEKQGDQKQGDQKQGDGQ
jgi:general secretion pathway protein J